MGYPANSTKSGDSRVVGVRPLYPCEHGAMSPWSPEPLAGIEDSTEWALGIAGSANCQPTRNLSWKTFHEGSSRQQVDALPF